MAAFLPCRLARWSPSTIPAAAWQTMLRSMSNSANVTKEKVLAVRKATGVGLDKCRKALLEKEGNVEEATAWVRKQAKERGWQAMGTRQDRQTAHGFMGLVKERYEGRSLVALLELNCETDFVARTDDFKFLLSNMTQALLQHGKNSLVGSDPQQFRMDLLEAVQLQGLKGTNAVTCGEELAEAVGKIGERLVVRRGVVAAAPLLMAYMHSTSPVSGTVNSPMKVGTICALAEFQAANQNLSPEVEELAGKVCQHIVGFSVNSPHELTQTSTHQRPFTSNAMSETNTELLGQNFLYDESKTVKEALGDAGLELGNFYRFDLGQ